MIYVKNRRNKEDDPTKRMPTSCADLNSIGHTLNAFYIVKENLSNSFQLQTIYCDFQNSASSDDSKIPNFLFYIQIFYYFLIM